MLEVVVYLIFLVRKNTGGKEPWLKAFFLKDGGTNEEESEKVSRKERRRFTSKKRVRKKEELNMYKWVDSDLSTKRTTSMRIVTG